MIVHSSADQLHLHPHPLCSLLRVGMGLEHVLYELAVSLYGLHGTTASSKTLHGTLSTCASSASACGSQKVISMSRYRAMAVARAVRAGAPRSVWPYSRPSPWWQWAWSGRMPSSSARARACW